MYHMIWAPFKGTTILHLGEGRGTCFFFLSFFSFLLHILVKKKYFDLHVKDVKKINNQTVRPCNIQTEIWLNMIWRKTTDFWCPEKYLVLFSVEKYLTWGKNITPTPPPEWIGWSLNVTLILYCYIVSEWYLLQFYSLEAGIHHFSPGDQVFLWWKQIIISFVVHNK